MTAGLGIRAHLTLLARSRLLLSVNAGAVLWVLGQVAVRARDASAPVTASAVAADLTDGVQVAMAVTGTISAAYLLGAHSHPRAGQALHLAGNRRGMTAVHASAACFLLSATVLGATAALALIATPLFGALATPTATIAEGPADLGTALAGLVMTLLVGTAAWTLLGGALGAAAGGRSAGTGAALLLFAAGAIVERTAVTYPAVRGLWPFTPGGAVNVLLTGRSIPGMPQSATDPALGVAGIGLWVAVLWGVAYRRSRELGRGRPRPEPVRGARLRRRVAPAAGAAGLAVLLVTGGWLLPPVIARGVPWPYTYDWRRDEAMRVAPDDVTREMLNELGTTGRLPERYFAGDGYTHARPYVAQLKAAVTGGEVFNVTGADRPGEVAIMVSRGGGDELMACLQNFRGMWRIVGMRDNLPCEDFLDEW
ncbi:hypothetical protein [Paractinoplanes rishiriensis]|uniref:Uncharacterized protein n=1 Tax=Paractinoplanes rishiriensis TaxID=1050105 RepID=A0A919MV42_9ACTN|nr:hypothetical protein [Actinoplanes rishiriensis]GIF01002.1 hypothetical protein Ari01nite_84660 [Actinoplanes rishiriensis]